LDDELMTSFEYSVVYHWYIVCLAVLLPVPLLTVLAVVLTASLIRKSRARHKRVPVKLTGSAHSPGVSPHRSSCACEDRSLDSLRLHIALIILYLLFTCPRATLTCLQGVFATSSRHSSAAVTMSSDTDVVYAVLESLSELAYSVYQASLLPLLASYRSNFRRLVVDSLLCRCCCCCCSGNPTAHAKYDIPPVLTTTTTTHGSARKSVKFDMQAVEFEIQY